MVPHKTTQRSRWIVRPSLQTLAQGSSWHQRPPTGVGGLFDPAYKTLAQGSSWHQRPPNGVGGLFDPAYRTDFMDPSKTTNGSWWIVRPSLQVTSCPYKDHQRELVDCSTQPTKRWPKGVPGTKDHQRELVDCSTQPTGST